MNTIKLEHKPEQKKSVGKELYDIYFENPKWYHSWMSGVFFIGVVIFGEQICELYIPGYIEFWNTYLINHSATEGDILFAYSWLFILFLIMFVYTTYLTIKLRKQIQKWEKNDLKESDCT